MTAETFTATVALIGIVILVASLLSGIVERTGIPQVAIFLLLGLTLGPYGLNVFDLALEAPSLRALSTLGLVLVLFSDAISLDLGEIRRNRKLAMLVLGPGSLIPALIIAVASHFMLGLHWAAAAIVGASLASTDPVLLRGLIRRQDVPSQARLALRLESGMNDVVLLPIVVISMLFLPGAEAGHHVTSSRLALGLFVLGPGAGVLIGLIGITLLDRVRKKVGVRRDYESLYALGVAFTAFAAAEAAGGSGFLAAFAAGITVAALDVELCDCFLDYGEATAEMFLLLTFVAFGASLIWRGLDVISGRTVVFSVLALAARTVVLFPVLQRAGLDRMSLRVVALFGPRGLSTLLLVLLPVFDGIPGAEQLFTICCLVVLMSVVLHGGAIALMLRRPAGWVTTSYGVPAPAAPLPAEHMAGPASPMVEAAPAVSAPTVADDEVDEASERITIDEMRERHAAGEQLFLLDVRTSRTYEADTFIARGAIRMPPDDAVKLATLHRIPWKATLVAYCA
ncbi:MAG TPA: cation:proton antiporter [Gemmatimonadaceae bacterium]|nr:cation:proton antiporter [Gemmatimonadaceae bacterium]